MRWLSSLLFGGLLTCIFCKGDAEPEKHICPKCDESFEVRPIMDEHQRLTLLSSKHMDWETPQDFFDGVNQKFGPFDLDVAASDANAKCTAFIDEKTDALSVTWSNYGKCVWCNPPYGRNIIKWVKKAYEESLKGCRVVLLVPARTDTKFFHDWATKGRIIFIKGRLKFGRGNCTTPAPFPSMLVIFDPPKGVSQWKT